MIVAVCDDSKSSRSTIISYLKQSNSITREDLCYEFSSSEELLMAYNNGQRFDVVFLDVIMGEIDGVDAGIKIRSIDQKVIIVFVSNYPQYAIPAYDCEAFYFMVKPISQKNFDQVYNKVIQKYNFLHKYYIVQKKGNVQKILISDILYIEIYRKHLIFHTTSKQIQTVGKLSEVSAALAQYGFCQVHQGYLVNMSKITDFIGYDVVLEGGVKVMISIRRRAEVLRQYAQYLEKNY